MKIPVYVLLVCSASNGCCAEGQRMLDGQVKQSGSLPCFTVADTPEVRRFPTKVAAVDVYQLGPNDEASMVWSLEAANMAAPVLLSPDNCIVYGYDELPQPDGAAKSLVVGARYTVSINSSLQKGAGSENRSYQSYFCLVKGVGQALIVHQVMWNEKDKAWDWSACRGY